MIILTKEKLQKMKEDELRKEVLIPLLEAMGYSVLHYHGVNELGKDLICWKNDDLGNRKNLALVVKAVPLTGQAKKASGSVAEVQTQIQECFGKHFLDPSTAEEYPIHYCWVVSNQNISPAAREALRTALAPTGLNRDIEYIGGDDLWKHIEKFLPAHGVFQKLAEVNQVFNDVDTHSRPSIHITNGGIQWGLEEKFEGAWQEKPFSVRSIFQFPDTPEGNEIKEKFKRFRETGSPVDVPAAFIKQIEWPEFMLPFLGEIQTLRLGPVHNPVPIPFRIEIEPAEGEVAIIECLYLKAAQVGSGEITLTSEESLSTLPIHLEFTLPFPPKRARASFSFEIYDTTVNAYQKLKLLQIQECISKAFTMTVTDLRGGFTLARFTRNAGICDAPNPEFVESVRILASAQKVIGFPIMLPDQETTIDDQRAFHLLLTIFHNNGIVEQKWNSYAFPCSPEQARCILDDFRDGNIRELTIPSEETTVFLNQILPLGPVVTTFGRAKLVNEEEVTEQLNRNESEQAPILLKFVAADSNIVTLKFLKWGSAIDQ